MPPSTPPPYHMTPLAPWIMERYAWARYSSGVGKRAHDCGFLYDCTPTQIGLSVLRSVRKLGGASSRPCAASSPSSALGFPPPSGSGYHHHIPRSICSTGKKFERSVTLRMPSRESPIMIG